MIQTCTSQTFLINCLDEVSFASITLDIGHILQRNETEIRDKKVAGFKKMLKLEVYLMRTNFSQEILTLK